MAALNGAYSSRKPLGFNVLRERTRFSPFPTEWLLGFPLRNQPLDGAPARALCRFPASR